MRTHSGLPKPKPRSQNAPMSSQASGLRVASLIFALFAIGHVVRLVKQAQVTVGTYQIPMWVSVVAPYHRCHIKYLDVATLLLPGLNRRGSKRAKRAGSAVSGDADWVGAGAEVLVPRSLNHMMTT